MLESKRLYERIRGPDLRSSSGFLSSLSEVSLHFLFLRPAAFLMVVGVLLFVYPPPTLAQQQEGGYHLKVRPDIWYNRVDGVRVGLLLRGQTYPTIAVTPRDFTIGLWGGTRWPQYPLSYYANWKEPLAAFEQLENQRYLNAVSSIRAGLHDHKLSLFQRWKYKGSVFRFLELKSGVGARKRFSLNYVHYPQLWQRDWITSFHLNLRSQLQGSFGRLTIRVENSQHIPLDYPSFTRSAMELVYKRSLGTNWGFRSRLFAGVGSAETPPEMQWMRSVPSPYKWTQRSLFRARGTIPSSWLNQGVVQPVGGPNLRGYFAQDMKDLSEGAAPLFNNMGAVNIEFQFPNPANLAIDKVPILHDFMNVSSYLFFDAGSPLNDESTVHSNAGVGVELKINIPDYRQKPRGFFIRYDIPFWLSDAAADSSPLRYRYLIGVGSVFTL